MRHTLRKRLPIAAPACLLPPGAFRRRTFRGSGISTQKIIQIEEHGRTFRRRCQQILKFSQSVRLNHIALVRGQQPLIVALACKHIEMVEPEIVHDLLQLPLAVDRSRHLRHREFFHHALWPSAVVRDSARHHIGIDAQQITLPARAPRSNVRLHRRVLLHRRRGIRLIYGHRCGGRCCTSIRRVVGLGDLRSRGSLYLFGLLRPAVEKLHVARDDRRSRLGRPLFALRLSLLRCLLFRLFRLRILR